MCMIAEAHRFKETGDNHSELLLVAELSILSLPAEEIREYLSSGQYNEWAWRSPGAGGVD